MGKRPFEGLKVIDFCWGGVGPFHRNFLAYYGATVVRVESATRPDVTRQSILVGAGEVGEGALDRSPAFALTHPVKKYGIRLNIKLPQAIEVFKRLAAWSDVFVESFTAGTMERLGMGYDDLKKIKPDIIMYRTNGLGHTGPMASQPGLGQTWTSLTGFHGITGWPDRSSVPVSAYYTDHLAPPFGGLALIAAIDYRRRTGKGQCIDHPYLGALNFYHPPPFKLSKASAERYRPTLIGEDTGYVCKEFLVMTDDKYKSLERDGVFD